MVSFIVLAYNEERSVSRCIASLFKCAEKYAGLCEIIVVDDGSKDYTYEIAWSTIKLKNGIRKCMEKLLGTLQISVRLKP